jgi:hypothetical protein
MSQFHTPTIEEFRLGSRREFSFLVTDLSFRECKAPFDYDNPYSAFFKKARAFVYVEGQSYGMSLAVSLGRLSTFGRVREQIPLSIFVALREPDLLQSRYPDERGQLEEMRIAALALRRCAADFLAGDFSAMPLVLRLQADRHRASQQEHESAQVARAFMQASDAFHSGKFELAVRLLEPYSDKFGKAQQAMLNLAKKRIALGK